MKKLMLSFICVLTSVCGYAQEMSDDMKIVEADGIIYKISDYSKEAEVLSSFNYYGIPYKGDH